MKTYTMPTYAGDSFDEVAKKAKELATEQKLIVEFEFNGVICKVDENTVLDWLHRDYSNALTMDWPTVGPDCPMQYDADTEIALYTHKLQRAKERKAREREEERKEKSEFQILTKKVEGVKIEILPGKKKQYNAWVKKNSNDGYGRACVDYAEAWAKLMQIEIAKGKTVKECADYTQEHISYMGITGFMYGCVVQTLSHFWKHGEDLRKWHNKEYGVSEDKKGVVNPAILTIEN